MMAKNFWRGQPMRHHGREDAIRPNPEAPPMHRGPGEFDFDDRGADVPNVGSSQPKSKPNPQGDEFPLRHANVHPHRHQRMLHQVLMAHALRMHLGGGGMRPGADGTTMGTAVGGGAAGGGAG
jgi:hypothetical protein